jgi:chromosome partitioning protein
VNQRSFFDQDAPEQGWEAQRSETTRKWLAMGEKGRHDVVIALSRQRDLVLELGARSAGTTRAAEGGTMAEQQERLQTQVVAFGNQKGGVGKTTNTVHVAAALGEVGKKVLIIDLDMNAGATKHFGIKGEGFLGTFEVLTGSEQPLDVVLRHGEEDVSLPKGVELISSCRKLEQIDQVLLSKNKFQSTTDVLLAPIRALRGTYDYIFLDTAPNATSPTISAYKAADWFVLTAMPEPFAIAGLNEALTDIRDAQEHGNPNLKLLGLILCSVDRRTKLANDLNHYVHGAFSPDGKTSAKFDTTISRSTVVGQTQEAQKTLFQTHSRHELTQQYRALAREFDGRVQSHLSRAAGNVVAIPVVEQAMKEAENG